MRKITLLNLLLVIFMSIPMAKADTVTNYVESFDGLVLTPSQSFAPAHWGRIAESYFDDETYDEYIVEYTNPTSGGQSGAYLYGGSQTLGEGYGATKVNDILVTPPVGDVVSFYAKNIKDKNSSQIDIYICTKSGDKYTKGDLYKTIKSDELTSTSWEKFTLTNLPKDTYLGFKLNEVAIDEFTASTAEINFTKALTISSITLTSGTPANANSENKVTVSYDVVITNSGDFAFNPGDEDYSISIRTYSKVVVLDTIPINFALAPGETSDKFTVSTTFDAGETATRYRYDIVENISETSKSGSWIDVKPYKPVFSLVLKGTSSDIAVPQDFGFVHGTEYAKTYQIKNTGAAPLNVTAISLPEGFTTTLTTPCEVVGGTAQDFDIVLGTTTLGNISGELKISSTELSDKVYTVFGTVVDGNEWFEGFENGFPANMIAQTNWSITTFPTTIKLENNKKCAENSNASTPTFLISPKLTFEEGDKFTLSAAKKGSNSFVNVYYSTDRANWTLLKEIKNSEFATATVSGSSNYIFSEFVTDGVPVGDYYIGIEAGYARVDNLYGGVVTSIEHDFYITDQTTPKRAMVNYEHLSDITIKNMLKDELASDYVVEMVLDDKVVATVTSVDMAVGASNKFEFAYTPHEAGEFDLYYRLKVGSYVLESAVTTVNISAEQSVLLHTVGEYKSCVNTIPISVGYKNSISESIYSAEILNLNADDEIAKIGFNGYCSIDKELVQNVKVWMQNTADTEVDASNPTNTDGMTLVYDGTVEIPKAGTSTAREELMSLQFIEKFKYTGGNLRVVMSSSADAYKAVYFESQASVESNVTIYRRKDGDITTASWTATGTLPVVNFYLYKAPVTFSGVIVDGLSKAKIAGAEIKLTSKVPTQVTKSDDSTPKLGNVIYTTTTDENGEYSVQVYQREFDYLLTITVTDYFVLSKDVSFVEGEDNSENNNYNIYTIVSGAQTIDANQTAIIGGRGCIKVKLANDATVNVFTAAGNLIYSKSMKSGDNTIDGIMPGLYIVNKTKVVVK